MAREYWSFVKNGLFIAGVLASALFCPGCANEEDTPSIPGYVLDQAKFSELLTDIALAESAAAINAKNVSAARIDSVYNFDPLEEHGVSKATYDSTLKFYSRHPELYRKVYEDVLTRLSEKEAKAPGTKADSIRR